MINGKTVLAVIPARGGSKRVPRKNLLEYRGESLLDRAINSALESKYIDDLVVSTEDKEILAAALSNLKSMEMGGKVKVWARSHALATDDASCEDVMREVQGAIPHDWLVLLQPTSPQRTAEDIDACIERARLGHGCISTYMGKTNGAVYVATAEWLAEHEFSHAGLCKFEMDESHSLDINLPEDFLK